MNSGNITITTDASFYRRDGVGGWAFQIRGDEVFTKLWGPFKKKVESSTAAELKSLLNALSILKKKGLKIDVLTINADCEFIVKHMFTKNKKRSKVVKDLTNRVSQYLEKIDYNSLNIKHVKAHSEIINSRRMANDWCDKHAVLGSKIASEKINYN